jgi:hypothetical protein
MAPADDDVAAGDGVAVIAEIAGFKFEFDVDTLPALRSDLALGFAVWEAGLDGFDNVAELSCHHAEEKDDALFVDGFVAEATEVHGLAVAGAAVERRMAKFGGRGGRRRWLLRRAGFTWRRKPHRQECLCYWWACGGPWHGIGC